MDNIITLVSGSKMPRIGLGVWETRGQDTIKNINAAVKEGYRLIDTAAYYHNEAEVGEGIKSCGIPREELFITSKVWPEEMTAEGTRASFSRSLELLGLDYIDMFLLHWPIGDVIDSWRVLEDFHDQGIVKNIGVSNFMAPHLDALIEEARIAPALNQIESNPYYQQRELAAYSLRLGIIPQAWGPLGKGRVLGDPQIKTIAEKYNVSPAQVILRWELERGMSIIPKASSAERLRENLDVLGFRLDESDMLRISTLDKGKTDRFYANGFDPEKFGVNPIKE